MRGERVVWLRVGAGLESVSGEARVWSEPAAARRALLDILGVFPVTRLEIDLCAVVRASAVSWQATLAKPEAAISGELWSAIGDAIRGRGQWGVALPDPRWAAADGSDKAVLKTGLQLASLLRPLREASLEFVTLDVDEAPPDGIEKALAPALRNAQLYGWKRAIAVADTASAGRWKDLADVVLAWRGPASEGIGGGLDERFWLEGVVPDLSSGPILFGALPPGIDARTVVDRGRAIRERLNG